LGKNNLISDASASAAFKKNRLQRGKKMVKALNS